mmetsp:Transcript_32922/g.70626  ORF Transcript_32922/g.70626 Transcript_32922/m.70626 type:complete len:211 (+) Transcript_32922:1412-2044(+)
MGHFLLRHRPLVVDLHGWAFLPCGLDDRGSAASLVPNAQAPSSSGLPLPPCRGEDLGRALVGSVLDGSLAEGRDSTDTSPADPGAGAGARAGPSRPGAWHQLGLFPDPEHRSGAIGWSRQHSGGVQLRHSSYPLDFLLGHHVERGSDLRCQSFEDLLHSLHGDLRFGRTSGCCALRDELLERATCQELCLKDAPLGGFDSGLHQLWQFPV